ncbi:hypothetical protein QUB56_08125 [Microcoleus sp. AR_TQ3_B6]
MDTVKGLPTAEPQLSPLYFILARFWVQSLGPQVAAVRSLSAWISLLVFPRLYWLCWELFRSASVGGMAVTIVAVGPFHVLYAQEAIPYMIFAALVLLSNAILRRAIALQNSPARFKYTSKLSKAVWSIYAIAPSLRLYSSLLFFLVTFAHCLYVIRTKNWRFSKILIAYLLASAAAIILLAAGIFVLIYHLKKMRQQYAVPVFLCL